MISINRKFPLYLAYSLYAPSLAARIRITRQEDLILMARPITDNTLYYGDNLNILRDYIPDESVDLIYLDPPFNSSRTYNGTARLEMPLAEFTTFKQAQQVKEDGPEQGKLFG